MPNRALDWFRQAERDIDQAEDSLRAGRHEWACFASHQAAEKAAKALHLHLKHEAWGHVIVRLLHELLPEVDVPQELIDNAQVLDGFYISSRYPNSYPEGAPFEHFGPVQSGDGIRYAREVVEFVRQKMA